MFWLIAGALVAYLVGAIPFGLLIGFVKKVDVRKFGSSNIGATNVARVLGSFKWFVLVFILDFLKGLASPLLLAFLALKLAQPGSSPALFFVNNPEYVSTIYGLLAIIGHMFPIYILFKGGKGVATGAGVVLALSPIAFLIGFVSLSSILAALALTVAHIMLNLNEAFNQRLPVSIFCILIALLVIIRHRTNIVRLIKGSEPKISFSKRKM